MRRLGKGLTTIAVIVALTAAGRAADLNPTTMGFVYLFAVVFLSMWGGLAAGIVASLLATAGYNFFFLPPLHTFHIDDRRNWLALTTFLLASLVVTRIVVSARLQAAEAERRALRESDMLKTSLLRAVSHDLTTPLTAIRIHTESLKRHPDIADTVTAIAEETARLQRRIDNLLTMARVEGGRYTPRPEPTPPADIFRAVRESLPPVFVSRPVTIVIAADCPDVHVDPSLALEIMVNLVENAHRASPAGAPIELTAHAENRHVRLEVLDRGPGIAADSDVAQRGLGLEIARSLASASGGTFALTNREGGGAIARVDLPAAMLNP